MWTNIAPRASEAVRIFVAMAAAAREEGKPDEWVLVRVGGASQVVLAVVCGVVVASVYAGQPVQGPMGCDLDVPVDSLGWFVATGGSDEGRCRGLTRCFT